MTMPQFDNSQSDHSQTTTGPQLPAQAIAALSCGRKIDAIKIVRTQTGLGLKQSKTLVEAYEQQHPQQYRQSHAASSVVGITATKSRHSVTVGILVLLLVVVMLGLIFF